MAILPPSLSHGPERSRFNRRRRQLWQAINLVGQALLRWLDLAQDRHVLLDSLPVPVVQFHLAPNAGSDWREHEASFGKVSSKKMTIFGYTLHLLLTCNGVILDFEWAPASCADLAVGQEMLSAYRDLRALADKAYISAPAAEQLAEQGVRLLTLPRSNQKQQLPRSAQRLRNRLRQMIETVNGQLAEQFHIERNHAQFLGFMYAVVLKVDCPHVVRLYQSLAR